MEHSGQSLFQKRLINYIVGGVGALLLTLSAFILVMTHVAGGWMMATIILCLAAAQAVTQLYLFLHLGEEKKPYWKNFSLLFTVLTVCIIVGGSLWVMIHLNYNMRLTPAEVNQYMSQQNKEGF
ncbi:MAG TPA: cytochrome o ubiquinol oxidase subunit IV [Candidatus Saccharimonadaceae bacterium]|nr:cytochrome o ubiquinol oxidase subunit IV [Candidatus Saccharimonadaceae bacterium]